MNSENNKKSDQKQREPIRWDEFLEKEPPGKFVSIKDLVRVDQRYKMDDRFYLLMPEIQLHCDDCKGIRVFSYQGDDCLLNEVTWSYHFLFYHCRNCQDTLKVFAIVSFKNPTGLDGRARKFGEWPSFGQPTPSRLISLVGGERELFLTGRRAENQGMGIGAFTYYRRVVENQKQRIFDEIIKVSKKIGASKKILGRLEEGRNETQFTRAVQIVKKAIPDVLLIDGHNPLTLLHSALSEGLHAKTDKECLDLATSIRVILSDLAERLGQALNDKAELTNAITRLMQSKPQKTQPAADSSKNKNKKPE